MKICCKPTCHFVQSSIIILKLLHCSQGFQRKLMEHCFLLHRGNLKVLCIRKTYVTAHNISCWVVQMQPLPADSFEQDLFNWIALHTTKHLLRSKYQARILISIELRPVFSSLHSILANKVYK